MAARTWPALALCALAALSIAAAQRQRPPDPPTGLIVGQVVDGASGRPIGGAVVTLQGASIRRRPAADSPPPGRILTGSDGRFVFRDLPGGDFSINAVRPGYADGAYGRTRPGGASQRLRLTPGERIGDLVVRMWKHAAITGRVIDEAAEPVVGVRLRAFRRAVLGGGRRFSGNSTATTDDRGVYRFGSLVPGDYLVAIIARSVSMPVSALLAAPVDPPVGEPAPGFSPQPQLSQFSLRVGEVLLDPGRGSATPPPPAGARMFTYPTTFYPFGGSPDQAEAIRVGAGEERSAIDLQIRPAPTIRIAGVVIAPEEVARGVSLRLVPAAASEVAMDQEVAMAVTDAHGRFEFAAVPEGEYELRGEAPAPRGPAGESPSLWWASLPIHAGRDDMAGLTVALQPGLRVSGRIEFDGAPSGSGRRVNQIPLAIERADGMPGPYIDPTRVDAHGTFTSPGVSAGRYIVRVTGSPVGWMFKSAMFEGRDISIEPLELRGGSATGVVLTFTDRWTGVQGLVRNRRGTPDPDATVVLFPTHRHFWTDYGPNPRRLRSARTADDGTYAMTSLPAGDYYVVALPDEEAGDWRDPEVLAELARGAAHITVTDGSKVTQNLGTSRQAPWH